MATHSGASSSNQSEDSVQPTVQLRRSGLSAITLVMGFMVAGALLFSLLDNRRRAEITAPIVAESDGSPIEAPLPLQLPVEHSQEPVPIAPVQVIVRTAPAPPPRIIYVPRPVAAPASPPRQIGSSEPVLVFDMTQPDSPQRRETASSEGGPRPSDADRQAEGPSRVRASVFRHRGTTVAQGTLIPAVLETALDSSRPGLARAIVSRDARSFDGTRVLIPRGSRLIGEYRADAQPGQRRALITWTRLVRPDGATIALASPASDSLGRGGISGSVDNHFFQRFGDAILQSALDLGVNIATAEIAGSSGVLLGVPGSLGGLAQTTQSQSIPPTIKVRPGTAIVIFVARDLDFTNVERQR